MIKKEIYRDKENSNKGCLSKFLLMIYNLLSIKSSLETLIILFKPLTSLTIPSPTLSYPKQLEICLKNQISLYYI